MTTEFPPIDRDKSPLLDADHDAVRIADALRASPHITSVAPTEPGDETVWFRDADGTGYELSLTTVEPDPEAERVAYAWDAVVAAIGNHPHFIRAALEQPSFGPLNLNTITALTRQPQHHHRAHPHRQRVHADADRLPALRPRGGAHLPGRRRRLRRRPATDQRSERLGTDDGRTP
ncbi:hypothetical protein GCM10023347_07140 [Streptomyces chumphonensis]|uniref:Uncharacterized protein n=1 Tax=Streptomyces chumphonensis TaxID=1214925 RepID=A0A927IFK9_9ACTN|nr:hypothetical protein [Streptomyces chumphonensis]MBD3934889.1 hypothetical protein [Streptomyces chumphonensis]